ncbi:hypothetical protein L6452_34492 [Arctium lappa]|uniref:Uncharacterized protein n=1 Tax=Arctium lappa TaxID=4217 RepID=A0ACB8YJX6_ARCLA|nr:hypothetical protein L6452_34492 [Arctium lappa]
MASPSSTKVESFSQNSFPIDNGSISKPLKFNPNNFSLCKSRMMLFLEGVDNRFLTILSDGPLIPKFWDKIVKSPKEKQKDKDIVYQDSVDSSDEERTSAIGRYIVKKPKEYTDEEKRLIGLDSRVRAIIASDHLQSSELGSLMRSSLMSFRETVSELTSETDNFLQTDSELTSETYLLSSD